jgi:hypothetical protein
MMMSSSFVKKVTPKHLKNWLQIWCPVIINITKAAAAYALTSVQPLTTYYETLQTKRITKCPPKPRYSKQSHTRYDGSH